MDTHLSSNGRADTPTVLVDIDSGASSFEWRSFFFRILRNWYWVILGLALGVLIARIQLRYAIPVYRVNATLLIRNNESERSGGISQEQIVEELGFETNSNIENEIQLLQSRSLMRNVVDSLRLNVRYYLEGRIKTTEIYTENAPIQLTRLTTEQTPLVGEYSLRVLQDTEDTFTVPVSESDSMSGIYGVPFRLDNQLFLVKKNEQKNRTPMRVIIQNPEVIAGYFASKLEVATIGRSDVLRLAMEDEVPERAVEIINTLVYFYNKSIVDDKNKSGQNTLRFINERLEFVTKELFNLEQDVQNFRTESNIPLDLNEKAERYLSQISQVNDQLLYLEVQLVLLDELQASIQSDTLKPTPIPVASSTFPEILSALISEYNDLLIQREGLLTNATAKNPVLNQFNNRLREIRGNILISLRSIRRELEVEKEKLNQQVNPIRGQINDIPANERQLLQIMREQQIRQSLFVFLLQRREETGLGLAAQTSNSRLIDPATISGPVSPSSRQLYMYSLFFCLAIPVGVLGILELMDNKIWTEKEIRDGTEAPFLGAITYSKNQKDVVLKADSRSSIAESIRLLRTNLQFLMTGEKKRLLITSASSGEGKTFITVNLGMSVALSGKRTLLIGLDLRKPKLAKYLGKDDEMKGVTTYLVGEAESEQILYETGIHPNLFFIPSGPIPPNPAELLLNERLQKLLTTLSDQFDFIILDTAPVGLVTDAILLHDQVDASIFVTYFGRTRKAALGLVSKLYREHKLPKLSVILNGVKTGSGYGYRYLYGYQHGYNDYSYYQEKESSRSFFKFW